MEPVSHIKSIQKERWELMCCICKCVLPLPSPSYTLLLLCWGTCQLHQDECSQQLLQHYSRHHMDTRRCTLALLRLHMRAQAADGREDPVHELLHGVPPAVRAHRRPAHGDHRRQRGPPRRAREPPASCLALKASIRSWAWYAEVMLMAMLRLGV